MAGEHEHSPNYYPNEGGAKEAAEEKVFKQIPSVIYLVGRLADGR